MKVLNKKIIYKGKFLSYIIKYFEDKKGNIKQYEFVRRKNNQKAVICIPKYNEDIVLIKNYRIPVDNYSIEFPAGLIDSGEEIENAALRELKEETGCVGEVISISDSVFTSPGLTTEEIYFVEINVSNIDKQELEDSEDIEVVIVNKEKWNLIKKNGIKIQSWPYLFCENYFK